MHDRSRNDPTSGNFDAKTVEGFGEEWTRFDQSELSEVELAEQFRNYFGIFPWKQLPPDAVGIDVGCGSGRWARLVAPRVGRLLCCDASRDALKVARKNLVGMDNCEFVRASVERLPMANNSMDFAYSLGVLHHIPDTAGGFRACVEKLKPGAPLLVYIYYAFDNRPRWFRLLWRVSDIARRSISRMPFQLKCFISQAIATLVYYPLARTSLLLERLGMNVDAFPLSAYRRKSLYWMRTDALDRFGTRLEQRFTRDEIDGMMRTAGLEKIQFSDSPPYWCAVGLKRMDKQ